MNENSKNQNSFPSNNKINLKEVEKKFTDNKTKNQCEKILFNHCDIKNPENNFGIKLNHRSINNTNKMFMNGFCLVKIVWLYQNVGIIYLAFFQTFINVRRKFVKKITNDFHEYSGDFFVSCGGRHIVLLVSPLKNNFINYNNNSNSKKNSYNNQSFNMIDSFKERNSKSYNDKDEKNLYDFLNFQNASIFTYRPYKKLVESYIFKKTYRYHIQNKFIMEKFVHSLLKQRIIEKFNFLNSSPGTIILTTKMSVSKIKNIEEIESNKIISKRCLMIYVLQLNESKDELTIEISVEPVSGYYLFKFSEKDIKIYDERKFCNSLSNYYRTTDKEILETIKNIFNLIGESIYSKLCNEYSLYDNFSKKEVQNKNKDFQEVRNSITNMEENFRRKPNRNLSIKPINHSTR